MSGSKTASLGILPCSRSLGTVFLGLVVLTVLVSGWPRFARAEFVPREHRGHYVALEINTSSLSDLDDQPMVAGTFAYHLRAGYRWKRFGAFVMAEHSLWRRSDLDNVVTAGVVNLALGGEALYAGGLVRSSLALGTSILAFDAVLDPAGTAGVFIDIRPIGLRWAFHEHMAFGFDPVSLTIANPVIHEPRIVRVLYRSSIWIEAWF